ncbi:haloacid dehalogenase-like hydrolase domain-containing protein 2 [Convolutriloba macropyga]|uniref:haloacid dehalogenase-like hydrolase domain-containing protein 2 n=1 Tax=Convolutriloba macropyga TaxID=536237 RepID=UPI003F51E8A6
MCALTMRNFQAFLIDLSGTVHIEDAPTHSAVEAVRLLKSNKIPYLFVSNTSKESCQKILERLKRVGFDEETVNINHIFTSLTAANNYLEKNNDNTIYPLVTESSLSELPKNLINDCKDGSQKRVLVGLAPKLFTYENMNYAFKILNTEGAELIAMNKGRYHETSEGLALGPGPFVEALEFGTGKKATVIGKPSQSFFDQAAEILGVKLSECVMIGDDVKDDIGGALKAGVGHGVLVRTGKFRPSDADYLTNEHFNYGNYSVAENFSSFVEKYIS